MSGTPASASIGVQVAPVRFDLVVRPDDQSLNRELYVVNRGSAENTFSVTPVDLVISRGVPEILPPRSTPYSVAGIASVNPSTFTLAPEKTAKVVVSFDVSSHRPMLGGLLVVPAVQPAPSESGGPLGVKTQPQALVIVSAGPVDQSGELLSSVNLDLAPVSIALPGLLEAGPITATVTLRNTGNTYERVFSTFEFSNLGHVFLRVGASPTSAMPGDTAVTSASTRQRLEAGGQWIRHRWSAFARLR